MRNTEINFDLVRAQLIQYCNAEFTSSKKGQICRIGGISFYVRDEADLFLADELFRGEVYGVPLPQDCVVVDIGMNVGLASLYFANRPEVSFVSGFEPFSKTVEMAKENLSLNPQLTSKIELHPFALSDKAGLCSVNYSSKFRMGMSVTGAPAAADSFELEQASIELKSIVSEMKSLFERFPKSPFVMKMDCEGEEFALIPALAEFGLIDRFDVWMIEYHHREPTELLEILSAHGFEGEKAVTAKQLLYQSGSGNMIYASRTSLNP